MKVKIGGKDYNLLPNNTPEEIESLMNRVKEMGKWILIQHHLRGWTIEFKELDENIFGRCEPGTKTIIITLASFLLLDYPTLLQVILHEVAHALVGIEHGHNEVWKAKALEIGSDAIILRGYEKLIKVDEFNYRMQFHKINEYYKE